MFFYEKDEKNMKNYDYLDKKTPLVVETLEIIDEMFNNGEVVNFVTVAKKAMVSRSFLYNYPEIEDEINFCREFNDLNLDDRIKFLRTKNKIMLRNIAMYEKEIIEALLKGKL